MPKVTESLFRCPQCGATTGVKSTRCVVKHRVIRYRFCDNGHRFTTQETLTELTTTASTSIGINKVHFALTNLMAELGISPESDLRTTSTLDNPSNGDSIDDN